MLQNINCASPVAASTATRTLGRSARTSCPCETLASSNRSRSLKDCDCAVMRASIGHLLLNVVVRLVAGGGSAQGTRSGERGAVPDGAIEGYGTRDCGYRECRAPYRLHRCASIDRSSSGSLPIAYLSGFSGP